MLHTLRIAYLVRCAIQALLLQVVDANRNSELTQRARTALQHLRGASSPSARRGTADEATGGAGSDGGLREPAAEDMDIEYEAVAHPIVPERDELMRPQAVLFAVAPARDDTDALRMEVVD